MAFLFGLLSVTSSMTYIFLYNKAVMVTGENMKKIKAVYLAIHPLSFRKLD